MALWIGVYLPHLSLEVFRPTWSVEPSSASASPSGPSSASSAKPETVASTAALGNPTSNAGPVGHAGFAVMQAERVLVVSRAARDAGVRPGMRRASVLSLAPDIRLQERDPTLEILALQGVALALMQYSPLVTLTSEMVVLVEVAASLRLFGGICALRRRVRATLNACGFTARLSIAPTGVGGISFTAVPPSPLAVNITN